MSSLPADTSSCGKGRGAQMLNAICGVIMQASVHPFQRRTLIDVPSHPIFSILPISCLGAVVFFS